MSTSTIHPLRNLYLQEIEEVIEQLRQLQKENIYNIPKISWWLLTYDELHQYSYNHRHVGSCIEGIGCKCSWEEPESKFCNLYSSLKEIADLYQYEGYFKKEMEVFEKVKNDYSALMQWLKRNEKLGTEEFILFWIEWYEEDKEIVRPFIINWQDLDINFSAQEWQHTMKFLKVFNEIYWNSDACPPIEELK